MNLGVWILAFVMVVLGLLVVWALGGVEQCHNTINRALGGPIYQPPTDDAPGDLDGPSAFHGDDRARDEL